VGPRGPAGPQGPAGSSDAWVGASGSFASVNADPTLLISKSVPAGSYLVDVDGFVASADPNNRPALYATCEVTAGTQSLDLVGGYVSLSTRTTVQSRRWITLAAPGTLAVTCWLNGPSQNDYADLRLRAQQVTLH
jgi:hypothetical protein